MKETNNVGSSPEVEHVAPGSENLNKAGDNVDAFESSKEAPNDESDTLSDIDDFEVMGYLHNEEESRLKKIIWEQLPENKAYMQEQAAKEAAARKLYTGTPEEILAAKAAQAVASKKAKDKRKRELEAKNAKPAETAAEAAGQHFKNKLSSKINYDVLNDFFGDEDPSPKKNRVDDSINDKEEEIANEDGDDDNNDEEDERNYDNEQQMSDVYVDDDFY